MPPISWALLQQQDSETSAAICASFNTLPDFLQVYLPPPTHPLSPFFPPALRLTPSRKKNCEGGASDDEGDSGP